MDKIDDECDEKANRKKIRDLIKKKLGINYDSKGYYKSTHSQGGFKDIRFITEEEKNTEEE